MKKHILSVVLLFQLFTCSTIVSQSINSPQYKKWKSKNIHNYTIDQSRSCFCPNSGEVVRITVRSDKIERIICVSDSSEVNFPLFYTIDSLFGIIQAHEYDSIGVKYNEDYGYPESLDIDPQTHPVDGGVLYETNNLKIVQ
jgi:hypothetical protein